MPGVEGIKGASLPPPGLYVRDYNVAYYTTRLNDPTGHEIGARRSEVFIYANVPRLIWITDIKFLGGSVGVDGLLPLVYTSVAFNRRPPAPRYSDTASASAISSRKPPSPGTSPVRLLRGRRRLDADWRFTQQAPPPPSARAGLGYWTPMLTAGATWYIDKEKTWAVSALNRYEFNTEQRDTDVTPGRLTPWSGASARRSPRSMTLGVVGYYQQQVTGTGPAASDRNRVAAIGPEISVAFPKPMLFVSLRYLYEFMAESRAQGHTFALTLTKRF